MNRIMSLELERLLGIIRISPAECLVEGGLEAFVGLDAVVEQLLPGFADLLQNLYSSSVNYLACFLVRISLIQIQAFVGANNRRFSLFIPPFDDLLDYGADRKLLPPLRCED